jgi:hypothetical protein
MTITADPLDTRSIEPPRPRTESDLRKIARLRKAYADARDAKKALYANWRRNYLLLQNRHWAEFRSTWMPSPADSEIYPILSSLIGWLTDQSVMFTIQAAATPGTPWAQMLEEMSDDLEIILQSNWKVRNHQATVTLAMWDAALYGAGLMKAVWDQSLEKGLGDADLVHVDPWNFYPDPQATNEKDGNYYIEVRLMSWDEVERRFPDTADELLASMIYDTADTALDSDQRPTNTKNNQHTFPMSFNRGYPTTSTSSTGLPGQGGKFAWKPEGITVFECWARENRTDKTPDPDWDPSTAKAGEQAPEVDVTYDSWRVTVWSSDVILLEAWSEELWDGATHPYGRLCLEDTGEFWPTPLVTHLAPGQIAINRLLAAMQQSAELTGNPVFMEPSTSGIPQTLLQNRPGQRVKYNPQSAAAGGPPQWLTPPTMSPDVLNLIRFWIERMENISGLASISKGKSPTGRAPEAVVNQVQESGFIRVRSALRNLERVLRRVGTIEIQLIIENYTTARSVSIVGQEGSKSLVTLRERHFIDAVDNEYAPFKYALIVNAGSEVPTSRQARMAEAQNLFLTHAIDRPALLEAVGWPHWPAIDQRMQKQEQAAAQQAAMQGSRAKGRR